jgi:4,5-dihydroxyphthalate decarboxylase
MRLDRRRISVKSSAATTLNAGVNQYRLQPDRVVSTDPMAEPLRLHAGIAISDRVAPLLTGKVAHPDIMLAFERAAPNDIFWRALHENAFDITEMSFAGHAILASRDTNPFVGLPIYTSRMFRHGAIYVLRRSGIKEPQDLRGRRIGVPEYQMTAAVWLRGLLDEIYAIAPSEIIWRTGGVNARRHPERVVLRPPSGVSITAIGRNETLNAMLLAGDIDAIMAPQMPAAFRDGHPEVRRLFENSRAVEQGYYRDTGIFPIMHILVMRRTLAEAHPDLPRRLFDLFESARQKSLATLSDTDALAVMLPWLVQEYEATRALMGEDYWSYGVAQNRPTIEAFLRHLERQALLARPLSIADLFLPEFVEGA